MSQGKGLAALLHFLSPTDENTILALLWRERKERNKIYAGGKKKKG
jgi:hypothetical protein